MSEEQEDFKMPRLSTELIDWLDEYTARPSFPSTPLGAMGLTDETIRLGCFQAGARNVVDQLIAWRDETEGRNEGSDDTPARHVFETVLGNNRIVDQTEVRAKLDGHGPGRILPDEGDREQ